MSLSDELLQPIDEDSPAGRFLRYDTTDTTYSDIKDAREEEEDLPQGEWKRDRKTADWRRVEDLATEALAERSKDLQIAAWLTEALAHRHGFGGLADGFELLRGLLEEFWEGLFPPLEDGDAEFRSTALAWMDRQLSTTVKKLPFTRHGYDYFAYRASRKVGYEEDAEGDAEKQRARREAIEAGRPTAEDFDEAFDDTDREWYVELNRDLDRAREALAALAETAEDRFGDSAPGFRDLEGALEDVRGTARDLLERKLDQEPGAPDIETVLAGEDEESPTDESPDGSEGPAGEAGANGSGDGAREEAMAEGGASGGGSGGAGGRASAAAPVQIDGREDADELVARSAEYMREEDPTDPGPYLMLRGLRWGELREDPDGVNPRLLAAPPTDVRTGLKELLLDSRWEELLERAEGVMATPYGRGWLDLQRYVLTACDGLGSEYDPVAWAIRGSLASLLRDLPQLPELTLMDDSPTANRETREWLREEGILPGEDEEAEGARRLEASRGPRAGSRGVRERARQRLRSGDADGAIQVLMDYVDRVKSERDRFLGRTEAARIMVESGRESVALPILRDILEEIEEHKLEEWEDGETVALPLGLLYQCVDAVEGDTPQKEELYERVCRLDPVQALEYTPGGGDRGGAGSAGAEGSAGASAAEAAPAEEAADGQ